ncbi:MAG: adenylate/guanylate cyclase domain-containing protein [Bdellovibrionota bacterium]
MRIPISAKLIVITTVLLLFVTGLIAVQSSNYFEKTSKQREENVNLDYASARATEMENVVRNILDKAKIAAVSLMKQTQNNETISQDLELNFDRDRDFIGLEILKIDGTAVTSVARRVKEEPLKQFELDKSYIDNLRAWMKFPVRNVSQGSIELVNGTYPKGPSLVTIGFPLIKDPQGRITHIALIDVQLSALQKPFSEQKERTFFLVDRKNIVLAHSDEKRAMAREDLSRYDVVRNAQTSATPRGQKHFVDPDTKENYFGAYARTSYGATVFSTISEDIISEPAREVRRKAFFVAGLVLSGAIFFIFVFSMTLTSPIETLAEMIGLVSKGNFDVKAASRIKSPFRDEVTDLAVAFDNMTDGLKERDKVKSLFSKFHGSSVTDDLMSQEIGLGGQNRDVVVFFSDIRGFTAFSENRSPEEVVEMLNEYFGVMVSIINKNSGVVDKFIGDAIMAVWGAPKGSDHDAHLALKACMEMRKGLNDLNAKRIARGQDPIMIGMGLHAGKAISGTIGSDERMEYTVIGNTVNTSSRIEAATKAFGTDLLISDDVMNLVGDAFKVDYAGAAEVKGRSEALKMFKVRGYKAENGEYIEVSTPYSDYKAEKVDKIKVA